MTSSTVLQTVLALIRSLDGRIPPNVSGSSAVNPTDIDPAASWRDNGVDSLDLLTLITLAEDAFDIPIPDAQVVRLHTPAGLADWISWQGSG